MSFGIEAALQKYLIMKLIWSSKFDWRTKIYFPITRNSYLDTSFLLVRGWASILLLNKTKNDKSKKLQKGCGNTQQLSLSSIHHQLNIFAWSKFIYKAVKKIFHNLITFQMYFCATCNFSSCIYKKLVVVFIYCNTNTDEDE